MTYRPPAGVLDHPDFPRGLAELQKRGLTSEAAIYDPSLPRLTGLLTQFPDLPVIPNHVERQEAFSRLSENLRRIAMIESNFPPDGWSSGFITGLNDLDRRSRVQSPASS